MISKRSQSDHQHLPHSVIVFFCKPIDQCRSEITGPNFCQCVCGSGPHFRIRIFQLSNERWNCRNAISFSENVTENLLSP